MMSDRMLFLGRYRIDQQELTNSSNSRIVVDAIEAVTQDGEAGHQKVALHFLECKEDLDLERAVREAIVSHHKNSEIVSQKEAQPFMACPPSVPRSVTVEESVAVNDGGAEHKNVDFQSSSKGLMKGKLMKNARTGSFQGQNWTKRHFELAGLKLDYAEKPGEQLKKKSIELAEGHSCVPLDKDGSASRKKYSFRFNILDSKKVLVAELAAKTLEVRIRWVEAIRRACQVSACRRFSVIIYTYMGRILFALCCMDLCACLKLILRSQLLHLQHPLLLDNHWEFRANLLRQRHCLI